MKIAVLYSGGMDSMIAHRVAQVKQPDAELIPIWWDYGQREVEYERRALPDYVERRTLDWLRPGDTLPVRDEVYGPIHIPGRNLVFATLAACIYCADEVWLGALAPERGEDDTDKNPTFIGLAGITFSYALRPFMPNGVSLRAPLAEMGFDKEAAARWALDNGITYGGLARTWSCYGLYDEETTNRELPCGNCQQCLRRFALFSTLGRPELERYARPLFRPGQGRSWFVKLIERAEALGWPPASVDECAPHLAPLVTFIETKRRKDPELLQAAQHLRRHWETTGAKVK